MNIITSTLNNQCLVSGVGFYLNNDWVSLDNFTINGVNNQKVLPEPDYIYTSKLTINGFQYSVDSYIDSSGSIHSLGTSGGYSIDYSYDPTFIRLRWNYTTLNSGFNINDNDHVVFYYYTE